jgi:hypothetical protein
MRDPVRSTLVLFGVLGFVVAALARDGAGVKSDDSLKSLSITPTGGADVPSPGDPEQVMPPVSETPSGFFFPVTNPVSSEIFLGSQGAYFGYCAGGGSAGLACIVDATCPGSYCKLTLDNTFCLSYNMSCSGTRANPNEYGFNDVFETTYDSSPADGRQTWIERNWNYITPEGTFWRPFYFVLETDANSTCVGGTNDGAYCTLHDAAGVCEGGGACKGTKPSGSARWTFTPNNRDGNSSLQLQWPWVAVNARLGTDPYQANGFSSWMRSSTFNPGASSSGAAFTTYLDHANDRRGPWLNGVYSLIDFNATSTDGKVGWVNGGYFDTRISGATPSRDVTALTGVRSEINLLSTGVPQSVGATYGVFVQFNPTGSGIADASHTGILINTPSPPGPGTTIGTQDGLTIADQQILRSGGGGSAIVVSAQTTANGSQGNVRLSGGNWNTGHLQLADGHLWRDATAGVLRYNNQAAPVAESDGSALVTGTASDSHGIVLWGVPTSVDPRFDTGDEVCAASDLTCVETSELGNAATKPCNVVHTAASKWLAFCK